MNSIRLLIIGAGPIGLSCGIAAQALGIDYKIIEKGCLVNSLHNFPTNMTFFSSSDKLEIGNIPFSSLSVRPNKQEALEYYRRVAQHFDLQMGFYEIVESIKENTKETGEQCFEVHTSKTAYRCDFIVNATGFYDTPTLLRVPGEQLKKVQHYFTAAHHLFRQKVVVIGASNSAIDVALEAYRKGAEVTVLVRGKAISKSVKYWVRPDFESRVAEGNIKVYFEAEVLEIKEQQVLFKHQQQSLELDNDFVYAMTGYQPHWSLLKMLGVEMNLTTGNPLYNTETMETNRSRVYLAGVVCGGRNTREWFIENSRDHGDKIMKHIKEQYELKK
ncbi:MAG: YpdA family putative bacillithiol disulfide reductase [Aureispira sp.]